VTHRRPSIVAGPCQRSVSPDVEAPDDPVIGALPVEGLDDQRVPPVPQAVIAVQTGYAMEGVALDERRIYAMPV
jgi:hypothetical protein